MADEVWKTAAGWADEAKAKGVDPEIMPRSERNVRAKAERESWPYREREASGGGREYPLSGLPTAFHDALDQAERTRRLTALTQLAAGLEAKTPLVSEEAVREAARQTGGAGQGRGDVRIAILNLYKLFLIQTRIPDGSTARLRFADIYNTALDGGADTFTAGAVVAGKRYLLAVPAWVRKAKGHIAPSSLWNWRKLESEGAIAALDGRWTPRKSVLDRAAGVREYILGSVLKGRDISAAQLRDEVVATFGDRVEVIDARTGEITAAPIPTAGQICRWLNAWKDENADFLLHVTNPDKWRSKNRVALGDLYGHIERPNQLWEIDASPADLMLLEDDGKTAGRYTLYVLIDIYTRRIMVLVTRTAATAGALLLLKKGIEAWGKPEMVRTDQGSDFISFEAKRFFALLGIIHDDCTAYSPEQKGAAERHVKTVQHGIINQLPGYIGHSVTDRQKIEAVKAFSARLGQGEREAFAIEIGRAELQATLNDWCEFKYAHAPHGGLKGETPFNRATRWPGIQANWKAITGININALSPGVSQGNRGGVIATNEQDYFAAFRGAGLEDYVTSEADYAARGFDDVKALAAQGLLRSLMIAEERIDLGGNSSLALGTTPTPTLAALTSGGALADSTTYSVICVALSHEGFLTGSVANGINGQISRTNADFSTDTYGGGAAKKSTNATVATGANGGKSSLTASVVQVPGAFGYAWFWGAAGAEVLGAITSINSVTIAAAATGSQTTAAFANDNSTNGLIYDGVMTQGVKTGGGYFYAMPTGTAGTGTPLTANDAGGIVEIDTALQWFWDNYRLSPTTIWVAAQEAKNIRIKILTTGSGGADRFTFNVDQSAIKGGSKAVSYLNPFTMDGAKEIPIRIHPNMPPGTIFFDTEELPYPLSGVASVLVKKLRRDYYQVEWPQRTRKYEYGVYFDGVLQNYFPAAFGIITNIANG